jgi:precorrin-3B synthase
MAVSPAPRGACPRVWAPLASGDGLIVRVHPPSRGLSARALRALAELARAHANGQLELTRRANLQLRGVREAALPALQAALVQLGLAPADPATERRQVLLASPLSELDPACAPLEALATQIEGALAALDPRHELPPKFSVVLEGGSNVFGEVTADIFVEVRPEQQEIVQLSVGTRGDARATLGACRRVALPAALARLSALLDRETRMRDVLAARGLPAVRAMVDDLLIDAATLPPSERSAPLLGFQRGSVDWFGVAVPFGSGEAAHWHCIAQLAEDFGSAELRLAPRRSVLLPGVRAEHATQLAARARQAGLIVDPLDPLLRAVACAGAPACSAAQGETRGLARQLAREILPLLDPEATLHVSGCGKSCASRAKARITIVRDGQGDKLGFDADAVQIAGARAISRETAMARLKELATARR